MSSNPHRWPEFLRKAERAERRAEREEVQRLTRELAYKDRALAEAAALLVLQKNPPPGRAPLL